MGLNASDLSIGAQVNFAQAIDAARGLALAMQSVQATVERIGVNARLDEFIGNTQRQAAAAVSSIAAVTQAADRSVQSQRSWFQGLAGWSINAWYIVGMGERVMGSIVQVFDAVDRRQDMLEHATVNVGRLRQATAGIFGTSELLESANRLRNALGLTEDRMVTVYQAAHVLAERVGKDDTEALNALVLAKQTGDDRALRPFGETIATVGKEAEKQAQMMRALEERYGGVAIRADSAADAMHRVGEAAKDVAAGALSKVADSLGTIISRLLHLGDVAGAGGEEHDRALGQEIVGDPVVEALDDAGDGEGGEHLGADAAGFEGIAHGQGVHHRGQHAHLVGATAVHALAATVLAAEEIPGTDDQGQFGAEIRELLEPLGGGDDGLWLDPAGRVALEDFATHLQEHAPEAEVGGHRPSLCLGGGN